LQKLADALILDLYNFDPLMRWNPNLNLYTTHNFLEIVANFLKDSVFGSSFDLWTKTGVSCNLLEIGATGWVADKIWVKITPEFAPDEVDNAE